LKTILKPIFDLLTGEYALFDNVIYNYIAMAIVGFVAFVIAFSVVGKLYRSGVISSRGAGSIIHWVLRFIAFIVVFYLFSLILWLIKIVQTIPWWAWIIIAALIVVLITLIIVFRRKNGGNRNAIYRSKL